MTTTTTTNTSHNTEKVIYFLLCERKRRKPAFEDETDCIIRSRSESADPPKKRCDTRPYQSYRMEMLSNGSPIAPRRFPYGYDDHHHLSLSSNANLIFFGFRSINSYSATKVYINCTPHRSISRRATNGSSGPSASSSNQLLPGGPGPTNNLLLSPLPSPKPHRLMSTANNNTSANDLLDGSGSLGVPSSPGSINQPYWKSRLNTIKNSFLGTPRFHRRKMQGWCCCCCC